MTKLDWITKSILQIILFLSLYNVLWYIVLELELIKRDVSWGITVAIVQYFFVSLSVIIGVITFYKPSDNFKSNIIFMLLFMVGTSFLLYHSIFKLILIGSIAIFSVFSSDFIILFFKTSK